MLGSVVQHDVLRRRAFLLTKFELDIPAFLYISQERRQAAWKEYDTLHKSQIPEKPDNLPGTPKRNPQRKRTRRSVQNH